MTVSNPLPGTAGWLATSLDQEMIEQVRKVTIAGRTILDHHLPIKSGTDVANELGGRYLLRYVLPRQVGLFVDGSDVPHHVTPTPYAPRETVSYLNLPRPREPRRHVMLLDPRRIPVIQGPRWVRLGKGIEYILPRGFPRNAVVWGWEQEIR